MACSPIGLRPRTRLTSNTALRDFPSSPPRSRRRSTARLRHGKANRSGSRMKQRAGGLTTCGVRTKLCWSGSTPCLPIIRTSAHAAGPNSNPGAWCSIQNCGHRFEVRWLAAAGALSHAEPTPSAQITFVSSARERECGASTGGGYPCGPCSSGSQRKESWRCSSKAGAKRTAVFLTRNLWTAFSGSWPPPS